MFYRDKNIILHGYMDMFDRDTIILDRDTIIHTEICFMRKTMYTCFTETFHTKTDTTCDTCLLGNVDT